MTMACWCVATTLAPRVVLTFRVVSNQSNLQLDGRLMNGGWIHNFRCLSTQILLGFPYIVLGNLGSLFERDILRGTTQARQPTLVRNAIDVYEGFAALPHSLRELNSYHLINIDGEGSLLHLFVTIRPESTYASPSRQAQAVKFRRSDRRFSGSCSRTPLCRPLISSTGIPPSLCERHHPNLSSLLVAL